MTGPAPLAALSKARLDVVDRGSSTITRSSVAFSFNPKELSVTKSSSWSPNTSPNAAGPSTQTYVATEPRTITMDLFFDGWETATEDVGDDVDALLGWIGVAGHMSNDQQARPPTLRFSWGRQVFECYLTQVNARFTMFRADGAPLRATVGVTLREKVAQTARTNPTSGGPPGRMSHVVRDGDTLQSIAFHQYGKPTMWRAIAIVNGIDDPAQLRSGTTLLLPAHDAARQLA